MVLAVIGAWAQFFNMINWESIDNNDFIARINDYVLRVEQMDDSLWWYAVYFEQSELIPIRNFAPSEQSAKKKAEQLMLTHYKKNQ